MIKKTWWDRLAWVKCPTPLLMLWRIGITWLVLSCLFRPPYMDAKSKQYLSERLSDEWARQGRLLTDQKRRIEQLEARVFVVEPPLAPPAPASPVEQLPPIRRRHRR